MTANGATKAWVTRKGRERRQKAFKVEREAKTFAKKTLNEEGGFRSISFESKTGHEGMGIVDMVAVRRQRQNKDRLDVLLVQVKGGTSRLGENDLERLRGAAKNIKIGYTVASKQGRRVTFDPPLL